MKGRTYKGLRVTAIVLMGGIAAFDVLGGIGTVCAAFFTEKFPPLWPLLDYKWIYQIFVFVTLAFGYVGVRVTLALIRGAKHAYRNTLLVLATGVVFYTIRVYTSLSLRGKAAPTNINWYFHILTLLVFLLLRLPGLRQHVTFSDPDDHSTSGLSAGLTALVVGIFISTNTLWLASSHTYQGVNWADVIRAPLSAIGACFILGGFTLLALTAYRLSSRRAWIQQNIHHLDPADSHR